MRQRLGIAIALAGNPDFLILDEPVNGLDPQGIVEIRELILKLNREYEITVLISSHILDELARLATHFGFIDHGQMVKEISAAELEAACRKCIHVTVSDAKALSRVLEECGLTYTILSDREADIFGEISVTELTLKLSAQNCEVLSMQQRDESLENYYINLVGVQNHESSFIRKSDAPEKSKCFWGGVLLMLAVSVYFPIMSYVSMKYSSSVNHLDDGFFLCSVFAPIILSVFCSLFVGTEYSDGTIRNKIIIGHRRAHIYLANLLTNILVSLILCAVSLATYLIVGVPLVGFFIAEPAVILKYTVTAIFLVFASSSIFTFITMVTASKANAAVICILSIFLLLFAGIYLESRLSAPETYSTSICMVDGVMYTDPEQENPYYLEGTERKIYQFFYDFLPGGQMLQCIYLKSENLQLLWLYSFILIIITTSAGIFVFRRKDIK